MNLQKKKDLAARTLGVGKDRIVFNKERLNDIKEAITKEDMRQLFGEKAITIKQIKGMRTNVKRRTRRRIGSIKLRVKGKKREYMTITRKLRSHLKELRKKDLLTREDYSRLRTEIRARAFKNKLQLKERIQSIKETTK